MEDFAVAASPDKLDKRKGVTLCGVPVDHLDMDGAVRRVEEFIAAGGFHQVATVNINFLVNAVRNRELQQVLGACDLVVPDGMPLLWFSRWMRLPLPERVPGVDLIPRLAQLSAEHGHRIFFLGSSEASALGASEMLRAAYPGVNLVGHFCPPFGPLETLDNDAIHEAIRAASPDILLVGFGNPKQELWLARNRHRLNVPVCMGIGGSLDMLSGSIQRAPVKYQQRGLEWLYRTAQEPRRLARRYLMDALGMVLPLTTQMLALGLQGPRAVLSGIRLEYRPGATVAHLSGGLTDADCDVVEAAGLAAMGARKQFVLDLAAITYVGADAVQRLMRLAFMLEEGGSALCLTAAPASVRRVLKALRMGRRTRLERNLEEALRRIALGDPRHNYDGGDASDYLAIDQQTSHG